jgi:tryptophanyl-tRNA synthetase
MPKKRLMSGMRPTGKLHIGHYLGALGNWKKLQDEYDCFYSIVDWHALTTGYRQTEEIPDNIREMLLDWLSCGINPDKSTIYVQSHIPQIAELHLLLSMIVPTAWLERVPTYKDQLQELLKQRMDEKTRLIHPETGDKILIDDKTLTAAVSGADQKTVIEILDDHKLREEAAKRSEMEYLATYGFLGYPLLQTADILAVKGEVVPVGQDQLPHLELAREIVRRFHFIFKKNLFPEPESLLSEAPFVPGIDGRKMSKSYSNGIFISDPPEEIQKKVKQTITDPQKIHKGDPGRPEICNIFFYHRFFSPEPLVSETEKNCKNGSLGCVECKKNLSNSLISKLAPIREAREALSKDPNRISKILKDGAEKARITAEKTLTEAKTSMRLLPL